MRIVDVCAFYTPHGGGVKTYAERKLRAGAAMGHEIIILAPGQHAATIDHGGDARVVTLPSPRFPLDRRYRYFGDEAALHAALDDLAPDVVEISSPWTSASMVARWRGQAVRSLVMHADPLAAYAYRWFGQVLSRGAIDRGFDWFWQHLLRLDRSVDLVVSASDHLSSRLIAGGLTKVETHAMGVEPGNFSPARRDEALRARMLAQCGLGPEATLLIAVGRLAPEKRVPLLIDAAAAAACRRPVGLLVIGDGRDRARVARRAGSNPHIRLAAPVTDRAALATLMASADALVHGCEAETFCMVAAEAKASGLPLIVPDAGGAADQFVAGQGVRYRAADGQSLVRAITRFAGDDPAAHRARATAMAASTRTMDDHFVQLFRHYAAHLPTATRAA